MPELQKIANKERQILNLVCEIQVRMFLNDPDLLERYYHAVIWSGVFIEHGGSMEMEEWWSLMQKVHGLDWDARDSVPGDDYWWYAREFMLLAHATGRDDLLRDVDASELYSRYEKWGRWMRSNVWKDTGWTRFFPHPDKPIWVERESLLAEGRPLLKIPVLPFADWDTDLVSPPPASSLASDPFSALTFLFGDKMPMLEGRTVCGRSAASVSGVGELPYIAPAISEFPARGKVEYSSIDYCCSKEACLGKYAEVLFAGVADREAIMEYCQKGGWSSTSRGAYTDQWNGIIRRHAGSIDVNELPIADSARDYELFKNVVMPKGDCDWDSCQLRINYNSREKWFTGHAWCLIRRSRKPEDTREL
jgi:hypothetical protein